MKDFVLYAAISLFIVAFVVGLALSLDKHTADRDCELYIVGRVIMCREN